VPHASTLSALEDAIAGRRPRVTRLSLEGRIDAGVAVPLHPGARGLEVVMIKRTANTRHHAREVAFPGGRRDPEDADLLATALRETHEELALRSSDLRVLGALTPVPTATSRYLLHPFVVVMARDAEVVPHALEVEALIRMPVDDFFDGRVPYRALGFDGWTSPIFDFDAGSMYGASAHILEELLSLYASVTGRAMPEPEPAAEIPWQ
jgi:8-oxo-dGTP pyrophosphatase MutT (NUDIX family)